MSGRRREATTGRAVLRVNADAAGGTSAQQRDDVLAVEEPLEIRVAGDTLCVTMRTPGQDRELAVGFAHAEGVLQTIDDLGSVRHCGKAGTAEADNTIDMLPAPGVHLDPDTAARSTLTTAACGVCGRQTVDDLLRRCEPLAMAGAVPLSTLVDGVAVLSQRQPGFDATGATHAAVLIDEGGSVLAAAEDIGRHNAVDKVVGALLLSRRLEAARLLVVSGRVSFEIVQKATVARIPLLVGVSAPTSLAVDLAQRMGITLAGFARGSTLNLYTHRGRVRDMERESDR